jgi:hypothetical protein
LKSEREKRKLFSDENILVRHESSGSLRNERNRKKNKNNG